MDAFLRRVIAIREREQEEAIIRSGREAFAAGTCPICGQKLMAQPDGIRREHCWRCARAIERGHIEVPHE